MSEIENVRNIILSELNLTKKSETASERIERIQKQMENLPSVLDKNGLTKLKDGEFDITLKEYTDLNSYRIKMNALYGNSSDNQFQTYLNNTLNNNSDDTITKAKDFIDKMKDNGMSDIQALKLYSALKSYSVITGFKNYNFVNAKI